MFGFYVKPIYSIAAVSKTVIDEFKIVYGANITAIPILVIEKRRVLLLLLILLPVHRGRSVQTPIISTLKRTFRYSGGRIVVVHSGRLTNVNADLTHYTKGWVYVQSAVSVFWARRRWCVSEWIQQCNIITTFPETATASVRTRKNKTVGGVQVQLGVCAFRLR